MAEILCAVAGCSNSIDTNGERYCSEHRDDRCIMKGCSNSTEYEGSFLCMVCFQSQKIILRNTSTNVNPESNHQSLYQNDVCITKGCINSREFEGSYLCIVCSQAEKNRLRDERAKSNVQPNRVTVPCSRGIHGCKNNAADNTMHMCEPCHQEFIKNPFQTHCEISKSLSPHEDTDKPNLQNQGSIPGTDNGFDFRIMAQNLPPIPSIPTKTTCAGSRNIEKREIIIGGRTVDHKTNVKNNTPLMPIRFDTLPPIPLPLLRSNSTPESRNVEVNELKFTSLPQHSLQATHVDDASPNCKVLDCHFLAVNDLNGYCFNCFTANHFENISDTSSAISTIPTSKGNTISKLPSCKFMSKDLESQNCPARKICKARGCNFFVNEGLGGYCSECFMCCNISDNAPPSPTHSQPIDTDINTIDRGEDRCSGDASSFGSQLCKGDNCEFFGSDEFNGYCSHCYIPEVPIPYHTIPEVRRKDVEVEYNFDDYDDDNKLCIICIQAPYNTVLLPCGHLYLCYECAMSITKKSAKCPACRSHIQSVHRVYTPD